MSGINSNFRTGYEGEIGSAQNQINISTREIEDWKGNANAIIKNLKGKFPDLPQQINSPADLDAWINKLNSLPAGSATDAAKKLVGTQDTPGSLAQARYHLGWWTDHKANSGAELTKLKGLDAEARGPLEAMAKLLESGDIEGAVMMLQTTRVQVLDKQLGLRIEALQQRNADIAKLNNDMAAQQAKLKGASDGDKALINAEITKIKGKIDQLNSDSQLDMIGIQGLVNKRNEAFDLLSNLLNKFQKTIDGIVGNMR